MTTVPLTGNLHLLKYAPTIWGKDTLDARESAIVLAPNVDRYDDLVQAYGDTIYIPRFSRTTASEKTPGTAINFSAKTESYVSIAITKQAYDSALVEDLIGVQSKYNLRSKFTMQFGNALARKVDSDLFALTSLAAQTVGSATITIGVAQTYITKARYYLDKYDAPQSDRFLTVEAAGYEDLLNIDNFVRYDALGKSAIENGKVGRAFGLEILQSTNETVASNIAYGFAFHKSAIALAMQKDVTMKDEYSTDYLGTKLVAYNIYGYTVARTDHLVCFQYGVA